MLPRILLALTALGIPTAVAAPWEYPADTVTEPGDWNTASINWAQEISPVPVTGDELVENISAPPGEYWCDGGPPPTNAECDAYFYYLDEWTADFMGLQSPAEIPAGTPFMPAPGNCVESCMI